MDEPLDSAIIPFPQRGALISDTKGGPPRASFPHGYPTNAVPFMSPTVRPCQFFDDPTPGTPVLRLMRAVLAQAVQDLCTYAEALDARGRRVFATTAAWFRSDDTGFVYSFLSVCDALALDPDSVRQSVFHASPAVRRTMASRFRRPAARNLPLATRRIA